MKSLWYKIVLYLGCLDPLSAFVTFNLTAIGGYPTECILTPGGHEYAGTLNVTLSGHTCQAWSVTEPHYHYFSESPNNFPEKDMAAVRNYCRNPDSSWDAGVWCYTTTDNKRWERCNVPFCECKITSVGSEYQGKVNVTSSGKACQIWDSETPHRHNVTADELPDQILSDAVNYCRNPEGTRSRPAGPWCYTQDADTVWEYCNIQTCDFTLVNFETSTESTSTTAATTTTTPPSTTTTTTQLTTTTTTNPTTTIPSPTSTRTTSTTLKTTTSTAIRSTTSSTKAATTSPLTSTKRTSGPASKTPTTQKVSTDKPQSTKKEDPKASVSPAAVHDQGSTKKVVAITVPIVAVVVAVVATLLVLYKRGRLSFLKPKEEPLEQSIDNPAYDDSPGNTTGGARTAPDSAPPEEYENGNSAHVSNDFVSPDVESQQFGYEKLDSTSREPEPVYDKLRK